MLRFALDPKAMPGSRGREVSQRKPAPRSRFWKFSFKSVSMSQK